MKYFEKVFGIGDLELEQVLFEFDKVPILFVCKDREQRDYLCLCTDTIVEATWMITQVNCHLLIDLLEDKIAILDAFKKSDNQIILARRRDGKLIYEIYSFDELPEDELPDSEERLENPNLKEYLKKLYEREKIARYIFVVPYSMEMLRKKQYGAERRSEKNVQIYIENYPWKMSKEKWSTGTWDIKKDKNTISLKNIKQEYDNYAGNKKDSCSIALTL